MPTRRQLRAKRIGGKLAAGGLLLLLSWIAGHHRHTSPSLSSPVTPVADATFTSTRYTTCLLTAPNGELWAGTLGGVLRRMPNGVWQKYTRQDGLPSNETRRLEWQDGAIVATFPTGTAIWRNNQWQPAAPKMQDEEPPMAPDRAGEISSQTCATVWQGRNYVATVAGLTMQIGKTLQTLPQPPSDGTHISALLPQQGSLWAAVFGDGLWAWNGRQWARACLNLPPEAREITALAGNAEHLWVGTRRAGVWEYAAGCWQAHQLRRDPIDHNCQALRMVGGSLWVSTQEDGLAVRTPQGWGHYSAGALASNSPRQMAEFGGAVYLRHGNGKVDCFTSGKWERNICAGLPRREVSALGADKSRLYAAQWGGWSEWDGQAWAHYLDLPELQGLPITCLYPQGDTLWIGTQSRGLAEFSRTSRRLRWHDERSGLPDDWITTLACMDGKMVAGTFVGGLARQEGEKLIPSPPLQGANVTALEADEDGGLYIATRQDVWHQTRDGRLRRLCPAIPGLYAEAQALCRVPGGLWIGTRTGLVFCTTATLQRTTGD